MPWAPSTRVGFDGSTLNLPTQLKYPNNNSPATLADGIEARLIELEARLQGGAQADRDAVFAGLNSLRATAITPAMPALAGSAPTAQAAAVDQFFRERAAWLWLTGHRWATCAADPAVRARGQHGLPGRAGRRRASARRTGPT
jgi:hypothetical protein